MRTHLWYRNNKWRLAHGLPERRKGEMPSLEEINEHVANPLFDKLAHNKLIQGFFRYTNPDNSFPVKSNYDYIQAMKNKIKRYEETHNLELLVDIANYAKLEFRKPRYFDAYYENEDDTEHAPLKIKNHDTIHKTSSC